MRAVKENTFFDKSKKIRLFIVRYFLCTFVTFIMVFLLLKFPSYSMEGVKKGIKICLESLIPSLYPFMILTNIYLSYEISGFMASAFDRISRFVFRLPGSTLPVILFSMIGGLPIGAKMSEELYRKGIISKEQYARMICFCVNPGPAFVISAVGVAMLGSEKTGILIYVSLIISSLVLGFATRFFTSESETYIKQTARPETEAYSTSSIEQAVVKSSKSIFAICAWVVAFSCLNELTLNINLPEGMKTFILCTSEITNGCVVASENFSAPIIASVIGFTGFCGHLQIIGQIKNSGIGYKYFLAGRIINSGLSAVVCSLLLKIFPVAKETFALGNRPAAGDTSGSLMLSVLMIIMAMLFVIGDDYRVKRKNIKKV